ncbi:LysR family transcriptional regulator [Poseidonocella sp. HB161398]|uniref:LysR family transcriptional regulator n=1 Tax=Poseidonocella sp. HB161398 TaxID=2320855 RepID=UPI0011080BD9|nr:LysR family transcriptional regulator [Poseidonocella sp. HB161398]
MDLRQLRYFAAVAEERNFTRAAETLNIAQPPLSRQIQLLEEELGVTLILRGSRPLRLTDAGRLFHEQALQVLGRVEQMAEATRRVGRSQNSVVKIGFVPSTLYGGLPSLVRKMRHASPGLEIRLVEMVSLQQIHALKEGRIDLGFGRLRHSDAAVTGLVLREERLAVALPEGHAFAASAAALPVKALAGQKLIVYPKEPRPSYADHVLQLLNGHGVRPSELEEVSELQTALGLVAAEVGLCVVPASARRLRADIRYRILEGAQATSPVVLSHRASDSSPYVALVKRLIEEMYAENPPWLAPEDNLSVHGSFDTTG